MRVGYPPGAAPRVRHVRRVPLLVHLVTAFSLYSDLTTSTPPNRSWVGLVATEVGVLGKLAGDTMFVLADLSHAYGQSLQEEGE